MSDLDPDFSQQFKSHLLTGKEIIDQRLQYVYLSTQFSFNLFQNFPKDMCYLLFDHYIEHDTIKDSIYASAITSILLGKTDPQNILLRCARCRSNNHNYNNFKYYCQYKYIHNVYYTQSIIQHIQISDIFILLACDKFKNLNAYDLLDNL